MCERESTRGPPWETAWCVMRTVVCVRPPNINLNNISKFVSESSLNYCVHMGPDGLRSGVHTDPHFTIEPAPKPPHFHFAVAHTY